MSHPIPNRRLRVALAAGAVSVVVAVSGCTSTKTATSADKPAADTSTHSTTVAAPEGGVRQLDPKDADAFLASPPKGLIILDVRTADEYGNGHLQGARNIDFYGQDFSAELGKLDKAAPYFVYCHSGNRSGQTVRLMTSLGFKNITELKGGMNAWRLAGFGVVTN